MSSLFLENLHQHLTLFSCLESLDKPVARAASLITESLRNGGKLLLCGNGGSAADCQHIAAEFTGRFIKDRPPISAISLTTDTSALTCIGNDYSFNEIFSRQVSALGRPGDILLGITTSGNSGNVLAAVEAAHALGLQTIGLLGRDGGKALNLCKHSIVVPSDVTARIQEAHILIGHTICGMVEKELGLA
jgi:D-sedoheptulose 7-phosphate isomerase